MESEMFIVVFSIVWLCGAIILVLLVNRKWKKEAESEVEQKKIFNKCIDLVIEGKHKEAKKLYNECLLHINGRRPFMNGLFTGLDLEKNMSRLLEHKYEVE